MTNLYPLLLTVSLILRAPVPPITPIEIYNTEWLDRHDDYAAYQPEMHIITLPDNCREGSDNPLLYPTCDDLRRHELAHAVLDNINVPNDEQHAMMRAAGIYTGRMER